MFRHVGLYIGLLMVLGCSEETTVDDKKPVSTEAEVTERDPGWKQKLAMPEPYDFKAGETYFWHLETNVGSMKLRLFHKEAPVHVGSTIYLTEMGFYDDTSLHRVISGFMAQGGDPTGTGYGGPGYTYAGEFGAALSHDRRGVLSMANAGPGTDGSQFFITFRPTQSLDGKHTIFGVVESGMDTLDRLEAAGSRSGKPTSELKIIRATIERKGI